jgi:phospholipid/cholesterol/gamma-HCH transport system ATP-binding protein
VIEFRNVNLSLGRKQILRDVSCVIPDDMNTVIIGRSGCGKTMMMKTMEGLYKPGSGQVIIDGLDISSISLHDRHPIFDKVAMVFQNAALLDSFTVFQNVALPLVERHLMSSGEISEAVSEILKFVGLENSAGLFPSELSGGMRKRIGLARAMVTNPGYVILDEPTTGLDPFTADEVMTFLKMVITYRKVIPITITHDPYCIRELGDYVIMMDEGTVIFSGTRESVHDSRDAKVSSFYHSFFE